MAVNVTVSYIEIIRKVSGNSICNALINKEKREPGVNLGNAIDSIMTGRTIIDKQRN